MTSLRRFAEMPCFAKGDKIFQLTNGRSVGHPIVLDYRIDTINEFAQWTVPGHSGRAKKEVDMNRLLRALKARHAIMETRVTEEQRRPRPDPIRLRSLKTIKLQLRDQIASLERILGETKGQVTDRLQSKRRHVTS